VVSTGISSSELGGILVLFLEELVMGGLALVLFLGGLALVLVLGGLALALFLEALALFFEELALALFLEELSLVLFLEELALVLVLGGLALEPTMGESATIGDSTTGEVTIGVIIGDFATGESAVVGEMANDEGDSSEVGSCCFLLRLRTVRQFLLPLFFLFALQ
jgi:hypothetical protein